MTTAAYQCQVQPPTPVLCNGTFTDCLEQQQDASGANNNSCTSSLDSAGHLQAQQQQQQHLRRNSSNGASSWEMTNEDTLSNSNSSSSLSGSQRLTHTHDPYGMNRSQNSSSNGHRSRGNQNTRAAPQQPQSTTEQPPYPMYNNHGHQQQQHQQNLPPSLQLASQGRRRQENDDLFPQQESNGGFVAHTQDNQGGHASASNTPSKPFPECCYHKALVNRMEFIQPPAVREAGNFSSNTRSTNYLRVFVGQCRFESTPAEVRWLIHYLTNVQPVRVELRGTGCFMAYVQSYEEVHALLQLKEKMLFDHTGVWFARDEEQVCFLRRYVQTYVAGIGKGFRLPKDMVVLHDQQQVQQQQQRHQQPKQHYNGGGFQRNNNNGQQSHHHGNGNCQYNQAQTQQRSQYNNFYNDNNQEQSTYPHQQQQSTYSGANCEYYS